MANTYQKLFVDEIFAMFCNGRVSVRFYFTFAREFQQNLYNCLPMLHTTNFENINCDSRTIASNHLILTDVKIRWST